VTSFSLFVLGCQYNEYDGEKLTRKLNALGYSLVNEKKANLIIVLACSVRQKPVDRIFGKIKVWRALKRQPKIILTGCVLPKDKKKLGEKVDLIVESQDFIKNLPKYLKKFKIQNSKFKIKPKKFLPKLGFVPITFGCDNFCTYCAVPYTRGQEVSRVQREIFNEIKKITADGLTKIMLLGQNVNSYGLKGKRGKRWSTKNPTPFVQLLQKVEKIEKVCEISFLSPNPQDIFDDFIDWLRYSKKFSGTLHLPVQSGSNKILKKMNRKYTKKEYLKLIEKMKKARPNICLSTDIIVGFPTETKKDFQDTVDLVKKIGFKKAYVSQYSPRPGTAAAKLYKDDVPKDEKKRRWKLLDRLINHK